MALLVDVVVRYLGAQLAFVRFDHLANNADVERVGVCPEVCAQIHCLFSVFRTAASQSHFAQIFSRRLHSDHYCGDYSVGGFLGCLVDCAIYDVNSVPVAIFD